MTITAWFNVPELREDLARLLKESVLATALEVLESRAKATLPSMQVDVTTLALTHAHLAGYQKAISDLISLAQPPSISKWSIANTGLTEEWAYITPKDTPSTSTQQ